MLVVDGTGIPLAMQTEAANISEFKLAIQTVDAISVAKRPHHPKKLPKKLVADKGYDDRHIRKDLRKRYITPYIPKRRKQGENDEPAYNEQIKHMYKKRWVVERTNAWLQNYRRIAMRWDKHATFYEAFIELGCIMICLRRV